MAIAIIAFGKKFTFNEQQVDSLKVVGVNLDRYTDSKLYEKSVSCLYDDDVLNLCELFSYSFKVHSSEVLEDILFDCFGK